MIFFLDQSCIVITLTLTWSRQCHETVIVNTQSNGSSWDFVLLLLDEKEDTSGPYRQIFLFAFWPYLASYGC